MFAGLFESGLSEGRLAGIAVSMVGLRALLLHVGVDILFVVDFLQLAQEGIALLGRGQCVVRAGGLRSPVQAIGHACGSVTLGLFGSVQHHLNNNE